ncbi:MAG: autotransporter-associated beta strand repeat-containing protein, partial [Prosthecobacter sp.]|nr:autotransporter-associated beta strand repeat-containing protein [Prosthecobacter sp.]
AWAGLGTSAGGGIIIDGATLALGPINAGGGGISTSTKPWTITGQGYLNQGVIRNFMGANQNTLNGNITMVGSARIKNENAGTLQIGGTLAVGLGETLRLDTVGFISMGGVISGSGEIVKYGTSGLRFQNGGNTYAGAITAILGEIRAENANAYNNVNSFRMQNSVLQMVFSSSANATANDRIADTTPIFLSGGRIRFENSSFTGNPAFNYAETLGDVYLEGGGNIIDMRSVGNSNTQTMTLTSLVRTGAGTTLFMESAGIPSGGKQLGTGTQSSIINLNPDPLVNGMVGGWAVTRLSNGSGEFLKYDPTFGYTALVAGDYAIDTADSAWTGTQNIKITSGANATLTADRTVNSLNIYSDTARTLNLNGKTLTVDSGGVMISRNSSQGPTHTISGGSLTAGAGSNYELYIHSSNANVNMQSSIVDNGGNAVSVVKAGPNIVSLLATQGYTGTTYITEGFIRDFIGYRAFDSSYSALGTGNLNINGSILNQSIFETDRDFTRALGSGVGEVQLTGGTGSGFGAYGAAIKVNFGGAGAPVVWGSSNPNFNPSIYTLNGGNSTQPVTLINPLDLDGEQRYLRLDGNSSGGGRGSIGIIDGDVYNGGIVKRGGGTWLINNAKTYTMGTIIQEGLVWVRGSGNLGQDISGNDVQVGAFGALHLDSPDNIGVNQRIILQNADTTSASAIGFGAGYGDGSNIHFESFAATGGIPTTGGNDFLIVNNQSGTSRRLAIQMNGMSPTSVDFPGAVAAVAPFVEVWFGASTANGIFTGDTLSPTGNSALETSKAFRLGSGGGTLTIQKANVLSGNYPLFIGSTDQNGRTNLGGVVYLPEAQNYAGQVTIGSGGLLVVGSNAALSTGNNTINLRAGELRVDAASGTYSSIDNQYAARKIDVSGGNSTVRVESLKGAGSSLVSMDTLRLDGSNRVLTLSSSTTRQNGILFNGKTTLNHTAAASQYFDIGFDNQGFNSGFLYLMGEVEQTGTGNKTLIKRLGGTLVLGAANTYAGGTQIQQGNLVLSNTSAAGAAGSTITMAVNGDRTARLNFQIDGAGPFLFNNPLSFTGGNNGSNRIVTVAPATLSPTNVNQEVQVPSISWAAVSGVTNLDLIIDGYQGYRFTVNGNVTLARDINFRTRGALTTINGQITGAFNVLKADQGTLWLKGNNTYTGSTTLNNGYLVLENDAALGNASSTVAFGTTTNSQVLLSGVRNVSRNFTNSATGGTQTLGGLDAGAKTFSGNITATRSVNVSSIIGGDVNFTGTISAAGGINKVGTGSVILNPTTGTGNTYTGATTVTAGTLIGQAQATSGSPFGANSAMTLVNGTLQLNGRSGVNSSAISTAAMTISGGSRVVINDLANDAFSTTLRYGSLARSGGGTVTFVPQQGNLGTQEIVSFTTNPTLTNGIVGTWAVSTASGSSNAADYVTTTGAGPYNLVTATYGGTGNLDTASGATQVFNAGATASTLTADRSVYAFRSDANVDLAGHTLNVGNAGQAGIILNNGADITGTAGSVLNFNNSLLSLYVDDAATSSLSVSLTNVRDNSTNTFSTNVEPAVNNAPVFVKFGRCTFEVNSAMKIQGGI